MPPRLAYWALQACPIETYSKEPGTLKLNGMRLPQSISQSFSTRVFIILIITVALFALPVWAGASNQQLTCAPCTLRFGAVPIGQTETEIVVLTNGGQTSVSVSAASLTGTGFSLSKLSLPLVLAAGQSASLNVTFSPTATGWTGGKGTVTSNASNSKLQLELAGSGTTSDSLVASPASVSFGQVAVGSSTTVPVVLSNTRSWSVKITAWQMTGSGFSASGPALPFTLNGGQSVTLNLTFAPQTAGISGGSVFVTGSSLNVPLNGTGTTSAAGQLTITPSLVNFGDVTVGTTGTQPITMSAANASVTVTSDASSSSQFVLNGGSLPLTIPAGQSMSFNVAFTPTGSGTVSGSLSFTSNASNKQTSESLTGTGTLKQYSVNLYWNAGTNVTGYNVYRSTSSNGTYSKINSALDPNTAYTDGSVASGATYYYEATAVNSSGQESTRSTPPVVASIP
jgi:hypothetical protein